MSDNINIIESNSSLFKNKNIAVGLFGIHYQENLNHWMGWNSNPDYRKNFLNNQKILYNNFKPTFFSSTYFSPILEELINDFSFNALKLNRINNDKKNTLEENFQIRNKIFLETLELIKKSSLFFDYVLITRYDLFFKENPMPENKINKNKINLLCRTKWGDNKNLVDDNFYFMPYEKFNYFYEIINKIDINTTAHNYHTFFSENDINYISDGKFYNHEIPFYYIKRD